MHMLPAVLLFFSASANSAPELSFSTEWSNSEDGSWLDHRFWEEGIPDGQTTAIMRGVEANGELKPYTVIIDKNGTNAQGDHPAGMIVLSHGATLVLRKNGVLDLSRRTGIDAIKQFGRPPSSKTGGRDWGVIPTTDDGGGGSSNSTDAGDEPVPSTSSGTVAGIVIGVLLVFVAVAGVAFRFSKEAERKTTLPKSFSSPTVSSVTNPAYNVAELQSVAQSSSQAHVADSSDGYAAPVGAVDVHGNVVARPLSRALHSESEVELYDSVYTLNPLTELEETEVVSLDKAVVRASMHSGGGPYDDQIELANDFYDQKYPDGAKSRTADGAAALPRRDATALHVYTQETKLYKGLNGALGDYGDGGRAALPSYLELTKLLIIAALKLAPLPPTTVYRGVTKSYLELLGGLKVGGKITWWAFTSATTSPDVLRDNQFLGVGSAGTLRSAHRTVFQIRVNAGRDISAYSAVSGEDEVFLLPGSTFIIDAIIKHPFGVVEVKMTQVASAKFALGVEVVTEQDFAAYASIAEDNDYEFESYDAYSNGPGGPGAAVLDDAYDMPDGYTGGDTYDSLGDGDQPVYIDGLAAVDGDGTAGGDDAGHYDRPDAELNAEYESIL